jgi:hypothetical protein
MEPSLPQPIATWSPTHDCWLTYDDEEMSLFSVQPAVLQGTFPSSGMTRAGSLFGPPTSERRTDGSASSSSLPTPRSTRGGSSTETAKLLPSPDAYERGAAVDPATREAGGHQANLQDVAVYRLDPNPPSSAPRAADPPSTPTPR